MKKLQYNSPVILTFFFASLFVLALDAITGGASTLATFCVYRSPVSPLFFVRLFGHVLGHSGIQHFLGNMTLLLVLGPPLEEKYGSKTLLAGIAFTAVTPGILQCILFPNAALLGASPGASTAAPIMLHLMEKVFKDKVASPEWQAKLKTIIPSYGTKLNGNVDATEQELEYTSRVLQLQYVKPQAAADAAPKAELKPQAENKPVADIAL